MIFIADRSKVVLLMFFFLFYYLRFMLIFVMLPCIFLEGLRSWFSYVLCVILGLCYFPIWCSGSDVVLDCTYKFLIFASSALSYAIVNV